jgi:hypothetical protein
MRQAARIAGIIWMVLIAFSGLLLLGSGILRGNRADFLILFCAALPGFLLYRWGRRLDSIMPARGAGRPRQFPLEPPSRRL